jgi:hypothetical protein
MNEEDKIIFESVKPPAQINEDIKEKYIRLDKRYNKYEVRIRRKGKNVYNSTFETLEEAIKKRDEMVKVKDEYEKTLKDELDN